MAEPLRFEADDFHVDIDRVSGEVAILEELRFRFGSRADLDFVGL